jgi:hypothetical protein
MNYMEIMMNDRERIGKKLAEIRSEKGTDYFVAPVYLEMLLYKVKEICS